MEILPKAKADGIATHTPAFFAYEQMVSLAKQQGGELFDENDNPTINTPEFKQAGRLAIFCWGFPARW